MRIFTDWTAATKSLSQPLRALVRSGICLSALLLSVSALHAQNAIQIENANPGTSDWQATNLADDPNSYTNVIEGYASLTSVPRGGQITFFVNVATPGDNFTMSIYRMGWYQGLGGRLVLSIGQLPGVQQTIPTPDPDTGLIECNWSPSYVLNLNSTTDPVSNWVSGVYIVLLTDVSTGPTNGLQRYMVFVVTDPASTSTYYFQCAVNTYQAFNNWGGNSLFDFNSDGSFQATKVSFNRPYQYSYGYDGSGDFLTGWEYDMVRFLEREGYDVTYGTDIDAHENPSLLLSHKALLIIGHTEYWSMAMRTNVIAARDSGEGLGFFGAVECLWQVRFEPSVVNGAADRTMVGYKESATSSSFPGPDPYYAACEGMGVPRNRADCPLVTTEWRESPVNMPENAFVGVMWTDDDPINGDILITDASNPVFDTTGLQNNDTLTGLLGYEVDGLFDNGFQPAGIVTLAASPYTVTDPDPGSATSGVADMTMYKAASGATVFAAATFQFSWGLDDYATELSDGDSLVSPGLQQMTRNVLATLIGDQPPLANPGGPYTGTNLLSIQFDGTGSSAPVGTIVAYQWDFGDGTTATGAQPTHTYLLGGTYTVTLIVTNSQGSRNAATTTATIGGPTSAAIVSLAPASLAFGDQLEGTPSAATTVTVNNAGNAALTVTSVVVTGDYSRVNHCHGSVAAGGSCNVIVTFTPTVTGPDPGSITITDNNDAVTGSTQTIPLSGTGVAPVAGVSPLSLDFPNQLQATTSAPMTFTLTDTGTAALTIASITPSGDFAESDNCAGSVAAPGSGNPNSCTILVTFTPTAMGTRAGSITITDNNNAVNGSTQTVTLSGTGVAPLVSLSSSSLTFSAQSVGTRSSAQTVMLTNTGTAPLTISSITAGGGFSQTNNCGTAVSAGANCAISVTFTPIGAGTSTGTLWIFDSATGSPQSLALSGTGVVFTVGPHPPIVSPRSPSEPVPFEPVGGTSPTPPVTEPISGPGPVSAPAPGPVSAPAPAPPPAPASAASLAPAALTFSAQVVGARSSAQTVTLTNTGNGTLTLTSIATSANFSQTNNCGASVAARSSCTIDVTFAPTAAGSLAGALTISDNSNGVKGSTQTVTLSGTGTDPVVR